MKKMIMHLLMMMMLCDLYEQEGDAVRSSSTHFVFYFDLYLLHGSIDS